MFIFRARGRVRAENGITRHIDVCSLVCTLIDNGKLANQIARLVATVVKKTNRMGFSVVCTLIDNGYASSQWPKYCGLARRSQTDNRQADNPKPHLIC